MDEDEQANQNLPFLNMEILKSSEVQNGEPSIRTASDHSSLVMDLSKYVDDKSILQKWETPADQLENQRMEGGQLKQQEVRQADKSRTMPMEPDGALDDLVETESSHLKALSHKVSLLENCIQENVSTFAKSKAALQSRMTDLEVSEKNLLVKVEDLAAKTSIQYSTPGGPRQSHEERLRMLKEEVQSVIQEKEKCERIWKDRLHRCQEQLKAKEEEAKRESEYFDNYKCKLQRKLILSLEREQVLKTRIINLETQAVDLTASAAMLQENLENCSPGRSPEGVQRSEDDSTNYIHSLQDSLRELLGREEMRRVELKELHNCLQGSQEDVEFLSRKIEDLREQHRKLKVSEGTLLEEVEELTEENKQLRVALSMNPVSTPSKICLLRDTKANDDPQVQLIAFRNTLDQLKNIAVQTPSMSHCIKEAVTVAKLIPQLKKSLTCSCEALLECCVFPLLDTNSCNLAEVMKALRLGGEDQVSKTLCQLESQRRLPLLLVSGSDQSGALLSDYRRMQEISQDIKNIAPMLPEYMVAHSHPHVLNILENIVPITHHSSSVTKGVDLGHDLANKNSHIYTHIIEKDEEISKLKEAVQSLEMQVECLLNKKMELEGLVHDKDQTMQSLSQENAFLKQNHAGGVKAGNGETGTCESDELRLEALKNNWRQENKVLARQNEELLDKITQMEGEHEQELVRLRLKVSSQEKEVDLLKEQNKECQHNIIEMEKKVEDSLNTIREMKAVLQTKTEQLEFFQKIEEEVEPLVKELWNILREKAGKVINITTEANIQQKPSMDVQNITACMLEIKELLYTLHSAFQQSILSADSDNKLLHKSEVSALNDPSVRPSTIKKDQFDQKKEYNATQKSSTTIFTPKTANNGATHQNQLGITEEINLKEQLENTIADLKLCQEELHKSKAEAQRWYRDLGLAECSREEAEKKVSQAVNEVRRMKEFMKKADLVKDGNPKLKQEADDMKTRLAQIEQERNGFLAQKVKLEDELANMQTHLQAKCDAEEVLRAQILTLRSQKMSLESKSETLDTVKARYEDMRQKYDELFKKKTQADLHLAPLKAKLSCMVQKCQQRNSLIVQMSRTLRRCGPIDSLLLREVEDLVNDAALLEYSAAYSTAPMQTKNTCSQLTWSARDELIGLQCSRRPNQAQPNGRFLVKREAQDHQKLTGPEKILCLHHLLQQSCRRNYQEPFVDPTDFTDPTEPILLPQVSHIDRTAKEMEALMSSTALKDKGGLHGSNSNSHNDESITSEPFKRDSKTEVLPGPMSAKSEPPAPVGSLRVVRTVGQCGLMIGWERPSLDELGCSNGAFVYGYRIYVEGEFHKSVNSSACTKAVLENLDLSIPINISVQTLGSNGLFSEKVHILFKATGPLSCPLSTSQEPSRNPQQFIAVYTYNPIKDSPNVHPSRELAFREGDTVRMLGASRSDGFCEAEVNGRIGLVPVAFLEPSQPMRSQQVAGHVNIT